MRIVWITPGFPADSADTDAVPYLQVLATALQQQGADLHIIAAEYPFTDKPYYWKGIPVYPCNGQNRYLTKARTLFRALRFVRRLCLATHHTVIHTFWWSWKAVLTECFVRLFRCPLLFPGSALRCTHFCTLMGQEVRPRLLPSLKIFGPLLQGRVIAVSPYQDTLLFEKTDWRAIRVLPWGIDRTDVFVPSDGETRIDIVGAGSFNAVKNWLLWIEVVQEVARQKTDVVAWLIGKGPELDKIRKKIVEAGLQNTVFLPPHPTRTLALQTMAQAAVLLHTASFEGFGYVLTEAAALGCRVVSTPVGMAPELAACGADKATLTAQVLRALQQNAPRQSHIPYSAASMATAHIQLYAQSP